MKVGVIGASGYTGGELLRLLSSHPKFVLSYIAAGSNAGELITNLHPHLTVISGQRFSQTNADEINNCDLVFVALPHGESAKLISQIDSKVKIVDLGADFRLSSAKEWEKYYGESMLAVGSMAYLNWLITKKLRLQPGWQTLAAMQLLLHFRLHRH